jgi:hypothetical protein
MARGAVVRTGAGPAAFRSLPGPPMARAAPSPRRKTDKNRRTCERLHILFDLPVIVSLLQKGDTTMTSLYDDFAIECFEAGRGLWHARILRADHGPLVINGVSFPSLEVGFAWSNAQAAIADAKSHIDRFGLRWASRQGAAPRLAAAI